MLKISKEEAVCFCGNIAKRANALLNFMNNTVLVIIFLYGMFALYDTWAIFQGANVSDSILYYKPELSSSEAENISISELIKIYPDARAWLTLVDTNIDYPVVQADDNQTYVNRDIDGNFSLSGTIFLDFNNSTDFSDDYNILYGHHMEMEKMFGGLDLYKEETYMNEHTLGYLFLPDVTYEIEIFATLMTDAYDTTVFIPFNDNELKMESLLNYIEKNASVYREITLDEDDRIIAMSTCSSVATNQRVIVYGRFSEYVE